MLPDYPYTSKLRKLHSFKVIIEFIILLLMIQCTLLLLYPQNEQQQAIQFRIVAHSNSPADQKIKEQIQQAVEPLLLEASSNVLSKQQLVENISKLEQKITQVARQQSINVPIQLERKMALIPTKRMDHYFQPQAQYDTFVLTIGSGRGDNWWCALFPKVCYDDEETQIEDEQEEEKKVKFFLWEWIKGWFF